MRALLVLLLVLPSGFADTLVLKNGLSVDGVVTEREGEFSVRRNGKTLTFPASEIKEVLRGESAVGSYTTQAEALEATDAAGWFRLGLWAKEKGLAAARSAFEQVLAIDGDHRAARRELGYERVGNAWVSGDDAQRSKGFVLCGGRWVLPAEADRLMRDGLMEQAPVTPRTHAPRRGDLHRLAR